MDNSSYESYIESFVSALNEFDCAISSLISHELTPDQAQLFFGFLTIVIGQLSDYRKEIKYEKKKD